MMDAPTEIKALADQYIGSDGRRGANRLPVLAREINAAIREEKAQEHKADDYAKKSEAARKSAMEWRLRIGAYLIEAKALVRHGEWLPWLRDNCALTERTAQLYMRVAGHKEEIEAKAKSATVGEGVADLSIRQANASIATPRAQPSEPHQIGLEEAIEAANKVADVSYADILEVFADGEWHRLDDMAKTLGCDENIIIDALPDTLADGDRYDIKEIGISDGRPPTICYRFFWFDGENAITVLEIAKKLQPLIDGLLVEGNKSPVGISPPTVYRLAAKMQTILDEWKQSQSTA